MFAGYQYMEGAPKDNTKDRYKVIREKWIKMKEEDPQHTIHVELAHFNLNHTLHYLMKYLFNETDSVGLNEQEIYTLYNQYIHYHNRENPDLKESLIESHNSLPSVYDSLDLIYKLVTRFLEKRNKNISRIQYHTLGHMIT
mmetsp:Transcript_17152/g.15134  ORF Transcript_17152/g.15134 Transcript_17152/m.15134 type:complete len:141 (+) Transcript_17152:664-1086(+)